MHDLAWETSATTAPADHGAEAANTQQLLYCLSCRDMRGRVAFILL